LKDTFAMGGYGKIYEDLIERLQYADIATSARRLGLSLNDAGEAQVPFAVLVTIFFGPWESVGRPGRPLNYKIPPIYQIN